MRAESGNLTPLGLMTFAALGEVYRLQEVTPFYAIARRIQLILNDGRCLTEQSDIVENHDESDHEEGSSPVKKSKRMCRYRQE